MIVSTLTAAAQDMHGELNGADLPFKGVSTDSRSVKPGELFVALSGPNFDGAEFVGSAARANAAGAVVSRSLTSPIPTIVVDDTEQALGALGAAWRNRMPAEVIGITGSNGKTTVKELLAGCLSLNEPTLATHGNYNNSIGLPLMLLRMKDTHRFAVIEMGANHAGEIAYLTALAKPSIVAITNAAPAHLEGFGSVEGVARAKGEILSGTPAPQYAVLNADDDYFDYWRSQLDASVSLLSFGFSASADVRASDIRATDTGSSFTLHLGGKTIEISLPLSGKHNVQNACAAAGIASLLGLDIQQICAGLAAAHAASGRLEATRCANGALLFDDTYNANPVSVQAAAELLAAQSGRSWLVLGDMAELGGDARLLHAHTGWVIREAGVDNLLATGPLSREAVDAFGESGRWYETVEELIDELNKSLADDDAVLVKGSRSMRMERVVDALTGSNTENGRGTC